MANGQQLAEQNFQTFCTWVESKTDNDFRQMTIRGSLSRREIAAQCGFAASALNQNPRIRAKLLEKEEFLREAGVLPLQVSATGDDTTPSPLHREAGKAGRSVDAERVKRLEVENASLRAANQELKHQIEKFAVLRDVLSTTGRLPR